MTNHIATGELLFRAEALIELNGDIETAFEIDYANYDIQGLPPVH